MTVDSSWTERSFTALNGGPQFKFNEAISFVINWRYPGGDRFLLEKLTADGGEEVQCGWLAENTGFLAGGADEVLR